MGVYSSKRISDPVHGTIGLSRIEARLLDTRAVQRLRNIKQLGLAYLVFPGANYSRLSHVLGVCHITGQVLDALRANGTKIEDREVQLYRLAGLLHDVGHYPFSHAMEEAIKDFYAAPLIQDKSGNASGAPEEPADAFEHERVGKEILSGDPEVRPILEEAGFQPENVYQVFTRINPPRLSNLVSSDFDADRIDYLLRTAHHSGLPYGSVDLQYLLSQIRTDGQDRVCLTSKALRAADHFLLCRYFDYQQVAFHKTVAAFEWLLKDVIAELLRLELLDCSAEGIKQLIRNGNWPDFDDTFVMGRIQEIPEHPAADPDAREKARAILRRRPPKLIVEEEVLGKRDAPTLQNHRLKRQMLGERVTALAKEFGISENLFHLWSPPPMVLTKIGSHVPVSAIVEVGPEDKDMYQQAIRVLDSHGSESQEIVQIGHSLMSVLSERALYSLRLYVLSPDEDAGAVKKIEQRIREGLPHIGWK